VVAMMLVRTNASLIVGEAPGPVLQAGIRAELESLSDVTRVLEVMAMFLGPNSLLVAARVHFAETSVAGLSASADEAERRLRARYPIITHVFLDPTPRPPD
jgi:divalent metal cation (Fe/Co/Zn/Cd) transporter